MKIASLYTSGTEFEYCHWQHLEVRSLYKKCSDNKSVFLMWSDSGKYPFVLPNDRMENSCLSSELPQNSWNKEELQPGQKHGFYPSPFTSFHLFFLSPFTFIPSRGNRNESSFAMRVDTKINFGSEGKANHFVG